MEGGCCFLWESSLKSRSGGLTIAVIYFQQKDSVSFIAGDRCCFSGRNVSVRVGGTGRRTDASPVTAVVLFSSYKLPKTVTVTTLFLFGPVM